MWEYQSPVGADGPVTQGQIPPSRDVFRAYRYGPGYPAFAGRELLPSGPIELDPLPSDCVLWGDTTSTSIQGVARRLDFEVFPNPVTDEVHVTLSEQGTFHFELLTSMGATMISGPLENGRPISCGFMPSGIYFLRIFDPRNKLSGIKKVIVQ